MAQLTVVRDIAAASATAAERVTSLTAGSIARRGAVALSLTGGRTPHQLYTCLADPARSWRARIDWRRVELFWSDERNVPPDHPDSNFGLANRTLIQHVRIPPAQVHRMRGERPAIDAAREYDAILRERRRRSAGALFDVMLLGIGTDGHIASMFPASPLLGREADQPSRFARRPSAEPSAETEGSEPHARDDPEPVEGSGPRALAAGVWVRELNQWRITLTPPAVLDSEAIIVIAAGPDKADAIAKAIEGELDVSHYPAHLLRTADDRVEWIIDDAAASSISPRR